MKLQVRRLSAGLAITPELLATTPGARLQLMCGRCRIPRDLEIKRSANLRRHASTDLEELFRRVRFRCRCGTLADALRVIRPVRDDSELLLLVSGRGEHHG